MRPIAWSVCVLLACTVSVQAADDPKSRLDASDAGKIVFLSSGTIVPTGARQPMALQETSVKLTGELAFPAGDGPFPAVVLAHGCAGNGYAEKTWAPALRQWGYATFIVDSFRGRGLSSICDNVSRLFPVQRVPDVYGALRVLATHPKIAPDRIALMGYSHGGILTISASTQWARETFAKAEAPRFRAFLPVYPYCNSVVPEWEAVSAPVRVHTGALDDWTPAKPCEAWVERLRSKGFDASITVYADAHHAFDDPFGAVTRLPNVASVADCTPRYRSILGPSESENPWAGCIKKGATVGRNATAIKVALETVKAQLAELLGAE